jgi:threonine synthase
VILSFIVSAAIYGLRNKANIAIFILHPKGRVSPIQEAQMTTVTDANVHNVAVKGTFDDCQVFNTQKALSLLHTLLNRILSKPSFPTKPSMPPTTSVL